MPPDYGDLPIPENSEMVEKQNTNEIEKLIKNNEQENSSNSNSSLEENLLDKIKKLMFTSRINFTNFKLKK